MSWMAVRINIYPDQEPDDPDNYLDEAEDYETCANETFLAEGWPIVDWVE